MVMVPEDTPLRECGVDSMHLLTLLLALQRKYGVDVSLAGDSEVLQTFRDVIDFVVHHLPTEGN